MERETRTTAPSNRPRSPPRVLSPSHPPPRTLCPLPALSWCASPEPGSQCPPGAPRTPHVVSPTLHQE